MLEHLATLHLAIEDLGLIEGLVDHVDAAAKTVNLHIGTELLGRQHRAKGDKEG